MSSASSGPTRQMSPWGPRNSSRTEPGGQVPHPARDRTRVASRTPGGRCGPNGRWVLASRPGRPRRRRREPTFPSGEQSGTTWRPSTARTIRRARHRPRRWRHQGATTGPRASAPLTRGVERPELFRVMSSMFSWPARERGGRARGEIPPGRVSRAPRFVKVGEVGDLVEDTSSRGSRSVDTTGGATRLERCHRATLARPPDRGAVVRRYS